MGKQLEKLISFSGKLRFLKDYVKNKEKCHKGSSLLRTKISKNVNETAKFFRLCLEQDDKLLGKDHNKLIDNREEKFKNN